MIGSLRGVLLDVGEELLVEVSGVGYRVQVSPAHALTFGAVGDQVFLHIHHVVREDAQTLYGFRQRDERSTFEVLIATHGIGPALAIAILGTHAPSALVDIVATSDLGALTLVPGVGKKTAERLLVELRNRLNLPMLDPVGAGGGGGGGTVVGDVREALTGLGYGPDEVRDALRELPASADASSLLRDALKLLGARRA